MPVAEVMRLYRYHTGEQFVRTTTTPDGLDMTASRTANKVFLHVVNTKRHQAIPADIALGPFIAKSATAYEIAGDPEFEVTGFQRERRLEPKEKLVEIAKRYTFPAASVTAMEIDCEI